MAAFRRAAGDAVAAHAFPKHVRKGVLSVGVDSPVWLQELSYLRDKLAQNLSRELGEAIREVRLSLQRRSSRAAPLPGAPAALAAPAGPRTSGARQPVVPVPHPLPELPPHVAEEVRHAVEPLAGEPELLEAAQRALSRWRNNQRGNPHK